MSLHPSIAAVRSGVRAVLHEAEPGSVVLVACSGGADSLALLAATVAEAARREDGPVRVAGVTVDHGLQEGSADLAQRVVAQMVTLGADETIAVRVQVQAEGLGPEAAAREARYAVLDEVAERTGAVAVLLGHTRDDQAETVLMGLARGSGARALAGMRRAFRRYRRPLLDVSRVDTVTACRVDGIDFWEDPHNVDPTYLRSRVRARVLPMLEEEMGPGVAASLARTADQLREDAEVLDALAEDALVAVGEEPGGPLRVDALVALPTAVRRRVLRMAAVGAGAIDAETFRSHVLAVDSLLTGWHGQKWIELPGAVRVVRRDGALHFLRPSSVTDPQ